jgi:hypothetical protein
MASRKRKLPREFGDREACKAAEKTFKVPAFDTWAQWEGLDHARQNPGHFKAFQ